MNTKNVILAALTGLTAGATLGILFAPDKGDKTRKKILKKKDDYLDGMTEKLNDLKEGFVGYKKGMVKETAAVAKKRKLKPASSR